MSGATMCFEGCSCASLGAGLDFMHPALTFNSVKKAFHTWKRLLFVLFEVSRPNKHDYVRALSLHDSDKCEYLSLVYIETAQRVFIAICICGSVSLSLFGER